MIKVISFDIGGTILEENDTNNYSLESLTKLLGIEKSKVKKSYKEIYQQQKGTFDELLDKFCKDLSIKKNNKIIDFFKEKFSDDSKITSEAKKIIKDLKNKGYKIILFSNNCCLCKSCIDEEISKYIDKAYYSYDLGYTKKESESYKIITDELNVLASEILHVGDTYTSDYKIPKENGFKALFYGNTEEPCIKINKLTDIYNYLGEENEGKLDT